MQFIVFFCLALSLNIIEVDGYFECPGATLTRYNEGIRSCSKPIWSTECYLKHIYHPSSNPTKYYQCVSGGLVVERSCAPGTCFQASLRRCTFAQSWTNECFESGPQVSTTSTLIPEIEITTQIILGTSADQVATTGEPTTETAIASTTQTILETTINHKETSQGPTTDSVVQSTTENRLDTTTNYKETSQRPTTDAGVESTTEINPETTTEENETTLEPTTETEIESTTQITLTSETSTNQGYTTTSITDDYEPQTGDFSFIYDGVMDHAKAY